MFFLITFACYLCYYGADQFITYEFWSVKKKLRKITNFTEWIRFK